MLPLNIVDDKPWDRIDRILNDFGLFIRLNRENLNGELGFIKTDSGTFLEMKDLSSGEAIAFATALWTWGNSSGRKTDLLLIDEFDAHLNPSIAEQFISVIKKYFVELGVQVIMTTHNPSTIVYSKKHGAKTIWMTDGRININVEYDDIVRELSNGLIDVLDFEDNLQLLITNINKKVLYTEGKTDAQHIKSAIKALNLEKQFENIFIFGCAGVKHIPIFMKMPTDQEWQIALFDSDKAGREIFKKVKQDEYFQKKLKAKKLKLLFVSCRRDKEIEDLFEDKVRANKGKAALANFMSEEINQTEENFKPILDKIYKTVNS